MNEAGNNQDNCAVVVPMQGNANRFGRVYFVTNGDAIKIGFAKNLARRMSGLQVGSHVPLWLIGSYAARQSKEKEFHRRLKDRRLVGEWFEIHGDVFELIQELEVKRGWIEGDDEDSYAIKVHNFEVHS
jgi:hypothetical protein